MSGGTDVLVVGAGPVGLGLALHLGSRTVPVGPLAFDLPDTAFPHLTLVRQMDVEAVLEDALGARGVEVERGTELRSVDEGADGAVAVLTGPAGTRRVRVGAVAGCDGVDSTVRACGRHRVARRHVRPGDRAGRRRPPR